MATCQNIFAVDEDGADIGDLSGLDDDSETESNDKCSNDKEVSGLKATDSFTDQQITEDDILPDDAEVCPPVVIELDSDSD